MKAAEKRALVPKLRFPEFRGAGEWKLIPLNKQAKRCTQKNRDGEVKRVLTNSAEYGVVDQRDYFDKDIATQGNLEGYFIVEKGDYVYNPRISATAPVGPISKNNVATGVMSPLYTVFRFNNGNNDFYALYFKTTGWHHYMRQASSTGARHDRMAISNDDFMAMPLPVTCPGEQQKIADCLASLDELITLEAQQLDTLKTHKKGLMQQLFPAEGETLPKLRFPEFRNAGEWEIDSFDHLVEVIDGDRGANYPRAEEFSSSGYCLFLTAKNVTKNGFKFEEMQFVTKEKDTVLRKGRLKRADVVLTTRGSVGQFAYFSEEVPYENMRINSGMVVLRIKTKKVNSDYLYAFCKSERLSTYIANIAFGNAQQQLTVAEIKKFQLYYPEPDEQQKVGDCLASLDDLITAQTQNLAALKTHKKGLMQQLFPALDEVPA